MVSVLFSLIFEIISELVFRSFRKLFGKQNDQSIMGAVEANNDFIRCYAGFQVCLSFGTFTYFIVTIIMNPSGTLWDNYQDLFGRVMNSVVWTSAVSIFMQCVVVGSINIYTEIEFRHHIKTNPSLLSYIQFSKYFPFSQSLDIFLKQLERMPLVSASVGSNSVSNDILTNSNVSIIEMQPSVTTLVTEGTLDASSIANFIRGSVSVADQASLLCEAEYLEAVFLWDWWMKKTFFLPQVCRSVVCGCLRGLRMFAFIPYHSTITVVVSRFFYHSVERMDKLGVLPSLQALLLPLTCPFWTHLLPGTSLYCWIFVTILIAALVADLVLLHLLFGRVTTDSATLSQSYWFTLALKFGWRLTFYLLGQTTFNYAHFVYEGVGYINVIETDAVIRCNSFYSNAFDSVHELFVFFNWL